VFAGGLGGGGDVGLSLMLVEEYGLWGRLGAVVSFANCRARYAAGRRVRGAVVEVEEGVSADRRFFEDKLGAVGWRGPVYVVCTRDPWGGIVDGFGWLLDRYGPRCVLAGDVGGDGLVLGYESEMGSYVTDSVARAVLAWAQRVRGVRGVVAVAAPGAEGGGGVLDVGEIAADLLYLDRGGALLGTVVPSGRGLRVLDALLRRAESGMLPLFAAAVRGEREARIDRAYLHGVYRVEPWYRYVVLLDADRHCALSPLCSAAYGRGAVAVERWRRPRPPRELERQYVRLRRDEKAARRALLGLLERRRGRFNLAKRC